MTIVDPPSPRNNQTNEALSPDEEPKLIVVAGPTAVGKTFAGIELALRFDGEVINADSRYLYRGMDIGVAKPNALERRRVPHHVIDVVDPGDEMSLATYQELAYAAINQTIGRGHLPFLVGGTPLYINAVVEGWRIPQVAPDWPFRHQQEAEAAKSGSNPSAHGCGRSTRWRRSDAARISGGSSAPSRSSTPRASQCRKLKARDHDLTTPSSFG
jgi:tRNA A37 N6-isopentenylltransferase MiaA